MTAKNEIKIINISRGMFQYFISFCSTDITHQQSIMFESYSCKHHANSIQPQTKHNSPNIKHTKKVRFCDKPNILIMHTWQFAYIQARKDMWQQAARDRSRFEIRINNLSQIISPIIEERLKKYFQKSKKHI